MSTTLKKPNINIADKVPATRPALEQARFIAEGGRKAKTESKPSTYRLGSAFTNILENDSIRSGQNKTDVLKACIAVYESLEPHERDMWLLQAAKM